MTDYAPTAFARYQKAVARELNAKAEAVEAGRRKATALAELNRAGASYAHLAELTGLSRSMVQQLVERGRKELDA